MLDNVLCKHLITIGADKGYGTRGFVTACRDINVTPNVARRWLFIVELMMTSDNKDPLLQLSVSPVVN